MKKRTLGLVLIIFPWIALPCSLALYAMISFIISQLLGATNEPSDLILAILYICRILCGLLGIVSILDLIIGTPVGIYFVAKKETRKVS
ncbi:MAG: hypothetical protein WC730_00020 [Patescibacteria group bacterium]|jgi:hypothetical protein